jgi:hypothetical protein
MQMWDGEALEQYAGYPAVNTNRTCMTDSAKPNNMLMLARA